MNSEQVFSDGSVININVADEIPELNIIGDEKDFLEFIKFPNDEISIDFVEPFSIK